MPNIAVSTSDTLSPIEIKKRRAYALTPFTVSREKFSNWFQTEVAPEINWTDPMIGHMFRAWVAGSGITEWVSDKELAARAAKKERMAATKAKNAALRAAAELKEKEK
jgi:hypothetical protein